MISNATLLPGTTPSVARYDADYLPCHQAALHLSALLRNIPQTMKSQLAASVTDLIINTHSYNNRTASRPV